MIRSSLIIQLLWATPLHKEKWERRSPPPSTTNTMIRSSLIIPRPWGGSRSESLHLSWSWLMGPLLDHSWCQTGLKKGGPWSPFLFTLVVEAMGTFVVKAKDLRLNRAFGAQSRWGEYSSFAFHRWHYTIYFDTMGGDSHIRDSFDMFQLSPSLKISISKAIVVGVGCAEDLTCPLANRQQKRVGKLPILNLRPSIEANLRAKTLWDPEVKFFEQKLST